jgi:predicted nucleic acid-binding protein
VIGELRQGIEERRRRDRPAAAKLDRWLGELVQRYADRTLPVDAAVAAGGNSGDGSTPRSGPAVDGMLAATALVHSLTLVTRNTRDVRRTGVRHLDPFS